jgi:RNA polymerase sigma-70 factor (ECF subfamily)
LFVRKSGHSVEEAQDLTQAFFARLLAKNYIRQADRQRGKFRTFLLSALRHFLADEWDRAHTLKRGSGQMIFSWDARAAEERYSLEPIDELDAATLFDRRWATTLLENVLTRVEQEFREAGRQELFATLRPFLIGEADHGAYAAAAQSSGSTVAALKMGVSRLRLRYRELLLEEIAQTVASPEAAEQEYHALVAAITR